MRYRTLWLLLLLSAASPAAAQHDIIARGLRHGTRPPEWMLRRFERDPRSFEFGRAWKSELEAVRQRRDAAKRQGALRPSFDVRVDAQRGLAVTGTFAIPVLPVMYANSGLPPVTIAELNDRLFSTTTAELSLTKFYHELSRGVATVTGTIGPWAHAARPDIYYEANGNGAPPFLGELLKETLDQADAAMDFRQFDRDGDGFVDFVIFVHPEPGGECGNANIWSHRWVYGEAAETGAPYMTADGVQISDYLIVPALTCPDNNGVTQLIDIGVIAHELGHAFGLPDLYATVPLRMLNAGIAEWGLMSYGNWNTPDSPTHMEAWSKAELGWIPVQTLTGSASGINLGPAETDGVAIRIDIPGPLGSSDPSGEYFLLENRQRLGSDKHLIGTGLLIWHVDETTIAARRETNTIMEEAGRKGLDLEEADGNRNLDSPSGHAWPSHPFPGTRSVRSFTPTSNPSSAPSFRTYTTGVSVLNITETAGNVTFDVSLGNASALLRYWGDVTGDGMIGSDDAKEVSRFVLTRATTADMDVADVDGSGTVDQRDALVIVSYYEAVEWFVMTPFRVGTAVSIPAGMTQVPRAPIKPDPDRPAATGGRRLRP